MNSPCVTLYIPAGTLHGPTCSSFHPLSGNYWTGQNSLFHDPGYPKPLFDPKWRRKAEISDRAVTSTWGVLSMRRPSTTTNIHRPQPPLSGSWTTSSNPGTISSTSLLCTPSTCLNPCMTQMTWISNTLNRSLNHRRRMIIRCCG